MYRIIEFRAWSKSRKIMYKHAELTYDNLTNDMPDSDFGSVLANDDYEIMQYIGIKDKNGVKIFEGDIVRGYIADEAIGVIKWDKEYCKFYVSIRDDYAILDLLDDEWVVIGNIYENKEIKNG